MDFLNSLDLDFSAKKSHRVRTWYLFEQYKTLEQRQLFAAKRLRNRSYQNKMLYQELSERRARRIPYKNLGSFDNIRQSKNASIIDTRTPISLSTDNFYHTFSEIQDHIDFTDVDSEFAPKDEKIIHDWTIGDSTTQNGESNVENNSIDVEGKTIEVNNKNDNVNTKELQENSIKTWDYEDENKTDDEYYLSECTSLNSLKEDLSRNEHLIFLVWSKFVSFAYQVIELNHVGFCSSDCSSQIFTAILACDLIFRGTGRICNILQPYTSPVKYADSDSDLLDGLNRKSKRKYKNKEILHIKCKNKNLLEFGIQTKDVWCDCSSKVLCSSMLATLNQANNGDSVDTSEKSKKMDGEDSLDMYKEMCSDCMYVSVRNPILKLIKQIDSQLLLCQDCKHI